MGRRLTATPLYGSDNIMSKKNFIVVKNVNEEDLSKAISLFKSSRGYKRDLKIFVDSKLHYYIFPDSDFTFDQSCDFVNFLTYPFEIEYSAKVEAYCFVENESKWGNVAIVGKRVHLYIQDDDSDHTNVSGVSEDNLNFLISFNISQGFEVTDNQDNYKEYIIPEDINPIHLTETEVPNIYKYDDRNIIREKVKFGLIAIIVGIILSLILIYLDGAI